jgi:hypothetical protein
MDGGAPDRYDHAHRGRCPGTNKKSHRATPRLETDRAEPGRPQATRGSSRWLNKAQLGSESVFVQGTWAGQEGAQIAHVEKKKRRVCFFWAGDSFWPKKLARRPVCVAASQNHRVFFGANFVLRKKLHKQVEASWLESGRALSRRLLRKLD